MYSQKVLKQQKNQKICIYVPVTIRFNWLIFNSTITNCHNFRPIPIPTGFRPSDVYDDVDIARLWPVLEVLCSTIIWS